MNGTRKLHRTIPPIALASLLGVPTAMADEVTDWNVTANEIVAGLPPAPANRSLAVVQTAAYEAVNAITKRYPSTTKTPAQNWEAYWRIDGGECAATGQLA